MDNSTDQQCDVMSMLVRQRSVGKHQMIVRLDEQLQRSRQRRGKVTAAPSAAGGHQLRPTRQHAQQVVQTARRRRRLFQHRTGQVLTHASFHKGGQTTRKTQASFCQRFSADNIISPVRQHITILLNSERIYGGR